MSYTKILDEKIVKNLLIEIVFPLFSGKVGPIYVPKLFGILALLYRNNVVSRHCGIMALHYRGNRKSIVFYIS